MRAYAILDGGGVKGAALAGCLKAAEENGVTFAGYGGTSAGSIVAMLASIGYTPDELYQIMTERVDFTEFLDDGGTALNRLKEAPARFHAKRDWFGFLWQNRRLLSTIVDALGLYHGQKIRDLLLGLVKQKLPALQGQHDFTFDDLNRLGCTPLKIVASDVRMRRPTVYSGAGGVEVNGSVVDAVRASMSYPFVFQPVRINDRYLVDGGLTSNLPVFLFESERRNDGLPVVAFDLVAPIPSFVGQYGFGRYCGDMLSTGLEASEYLLRRLTEALYHVPISMPSEVGTLDFGLTQQQREMLFRAGHSAASSYFAANLSQWKQARTTIEQIQARYRFPPGLVETLLRALVREIEDGTPARTVRANVMLPSGNGRRVVVYHVGMDDDPDVDLDLAINAGCSGAAWSTRRPSFADLIEARTGHGELWRMTRAEQNKVKADRTVMVSVPVFDLRRPSPGAHGIEDLGVIGVLSIDTNTTLTDTQWMGNRRGYVEDTMQRWADVLSWALG